MGCSFQNVNDEEARNCIGDGSLASGEAVDEMFCFCLQCFFGWKVRCPHITSTIPDSELVSVFFCSFYRNALIIHLDLLGCFQIIVYDHLAATPDVCLPHLHWGKPIDADVCDARALKEQSDVGHVCRSSRDVTCGCGRDSHRDLVEEVLND